MKNRMILFHKLNKEKRKALKTPIHSIVFYILRCGGGGGGGGGEWVAKDMDT